MNKEIDDFLEKFYDLEISTLTEAKFNAVRNLYVESKAQNIESMVDCESEWERIVLDNVQFRYLEEEVSPMEKFLSFHSPPPSFPFDK